VTFDGMGPVSDKAGSNATRVLPDIGTDGPDVTARRILNQMLMAKATELSRKGRYREAESLLDQETPAPLTLDLLARIRAQEGRLCDAETLWRKALELEPGNEKYMAALRRISRISLTGWARYGPSLVLGAVIAIVIFLTVITVSIYMKTQIVSSQLSANIITSGAVQSISGMDIRGVVIKQEKDHALLTFRSGLFSRNDRLTHEAKPLLTRLAQRLEPFAGSMSIKITGVVDNSPIPAHSRYTDNAALAMARALSVMEHMRKTSRLPADAFVIDGQAEIRVSGSGSSPENRLRNRTVVMRISNRP
jgi:flagellar motor protein MotB